MIESKKVHVAIYDTLADWEVGYLTAEIGNGRWQRESGAYTVVTVGPTVGPVTTMGGLTVTPDLALDRLTPQDSAMLVVPGSDLWDSGDELAPFARKAREFLEAGVPVAAICGGTAGLAREGLFDDREHTSAVVQYLEMQPGYAGSKNYVEADAHTAGDLITAGPTEPIAFAREIFAKLDLYRPEVLDAWYRLFKHSDPSAFDVLAAEG